MATYADVINAAEDELRIAKRNARFAREDLKDDPKNRRLRMELDDREQEASELGRKLAELRFVERIDQWHAAVSRGEASVDPLLSRLIPFDDDMLAAVHLSRLGVSVPQTWRSFTGDSFNDNQYDREPRGIAAA